MDNLPEYLGIDTSSTDKDELYFHTHGTDIDLAFTIEEDADDVEEDDYRCIDEE
jgi:hypothetical protein